MAEIPVLLHVNGEGEGLERIDAAEVVGGQNHRVQLPNDLGEYLQALQEQSIF